jgi:hypothetical protein
MLAQPLIPVPGMAAGAGGQTARLRDTCLVAGRFPAHRCTRWAAVAGAAV